MAIDLLRVIHGRLKKPSVVNTGSILLDKIDQSQGNSDTPPYAQTIKQPVYVPYSDSDSVNLPGFVDLILTDNVKLQLEQKNGVINKFEESGEVNTVIFNSSLTATPVISTVVNATGTTTITGTTFLSITPSITHVEINNGVSILRLSGVQLATLTATSITITDITVGGTPTSGWTFKVYANKKLSNTFTIA